MSPRKFIVAPNKQAAESYCYEHNIPRGDAMYVSSPDVIRGRAIHPSQVAFAPTWHTRPDADEIIVALDLCALAAGPKGQTA